MPQWSRAVSVNKRTATVSPVELADWLLFAQEGGGRPFWAAILPFIAIGFLFYFLLLRPERQKQNAQKSLLENLKKSDRVVTVGGIKGIVTNVQRDADEVTVNIDESTGTKIRITLASIARVEPAGSKGDSKSKE